MKRMPRSELTGLAPQFFGYERARLLAPHDSKLSKPPDRSRKSGRECACDIRVTSRALVQL
jgi:hypothetical protein